jgi:light-regulated signal transduction histidine kinase (bacteriophytochrome)
MVDYKKELEEFTYIVSHDLNAPLRHIKTFGNLLVQALGDKVTGEEKEYLYYLEQSVHKTEEMMAALLAYSRLNSHAGEYSAFDCHELFMGVVAACQRDIDAVGARIDASSLPQMMCADKAQMQLLFYHLLDNALKFRRDGIAPEIEISTIEEDGHWVFSFKDNGCGIAFENTDKAFSMFGRLHTNDEFSGIGAGLAIVKKIVERHGGEVFIESEADKGCVVSFSLPQNLTS